MKLSVKGLSVSVGIVFALYTLVIHLIASRAGAGREFLALVLPLHPGASMTVAGAIVHAIWMFIYGGIGGALLASLYNKFAARV